MWGQVNKLAAKAAQAAATVASEAAATVREIREVHTVGLRGAVYKIESLFSTGQLNSALGS